MELKGRCIKVMPMQTGMGKKGQWKKMEFVVETKSQYPKQVCLSLWGDKVDSAPAVGDDLTLSVELESREYNNRWYTEVRAWKIEGFTGNMKANKAKKDDGWGDLEKAPDPGPSGGGGSVDDLPFTLDLPICHV